MWLVDVFLLLVICPPLTAPTNGMINCSLGGDGVANPEETCSVTCNDGYQLMGSSRRTCQNNRSWSGTAAMCISE